MNALQRASPELLRSDSTYQQALREENMALLEYRYVLHIFSELALEGKIPNEADWPLRKAASGDQADEAGVRNATTGPGPRSWR